MRSMGKMRDLSSIRGTGSRGVNTSRRIQRPAVPTGINRNKAIHRTLYPRPTKSFAEAEVKRHQRFKRKLLRRYDPDEMNRRKNLTFLAHKSHTGKIDSEGFRKYSTVKGIPYLRDLSPHNTYQGKRRQYARQNEFIQTNKHRYAAEGQQVSPFRWKRDDGNDRLTTTRSNLTAYNFKKRVHVVSGVT